MSVITDAAMKQMERNRAAIAENERMKNAAASEVWKQMMKEAQMKEILDAKQNGGMVGPGAASMYANDLQRGLAGMKVQEPAYDVQPDREMPMGVDVSKLTEAQAKAMGLI